MSIGKGYAFAHDQEKPRRIQRMRDHMSQLATSEFEQKIVADAAKIVAKREQAKLETIKTEIAIANIELARELA